MNNKKWYKSRLVWSSILKSLTGIITSTALILSGENTFANSLPGIVTTLWGIFDIILRFDTSESIK